jgi:hypothetical protein
MNPNLNANRRTGGRRYGLFFRFRNRPGPRRLKPHPAGDHTACEEKSLMRCPPLKKACRLSMAERRAGEGVDFNLLNAAVGDAGAFPSHRIDMTVGMTRGFRAVFVFAIGNLFV